MFESLLASVAGSVVSGFFQQEANEQNIASAQQARDFNLYADSTKYQRAVEDLKAAGLNPMLAYGHAPSAMPSAPYATVESIGKGAAGAGQAMLNAASIEKLKADTELSRANSAKVNAETLVAMAQVPKLEQEVRTGISSASHLDAQTKAILDMLPLEMRHRVAQTFDVGWSANERMSRIREMVERTLLYEAETLTERERAGLVRAEAVLARLHGQHSQLGLRLSENLSEAQKSWWMREVAPYIPSGASSAGAAAAGALAIDRMRPRGGVGLRIPRR